MSLLQNEDFVLYQLRTAYLSHIKDGVGERLISVDTTVLNDAAFRAAGWVPNAADIKRTYSPPIPTAITAEYFQAPRTAGVPGADFGEDEEEGGMVTGGALSNETVGPDLRTRRKRRKEQLEEDDSSDLSDESDEEAENRPVNQIKFAKMPVRTRAGSSPLRSANHMDGPSLLVTSPSKPGEESRLRRGSLGANDVFRGRPRKDTTTSSELSSENELDASYFQRKQVNSRKTAKASVLVSERIQEDEREGDDEELGSVDEGGESDSSLDSDFEGTADSTSMLADAHALDSLPRKLTSIPVIATPGSSSPRKPRIPQQSSLTMEALPPPRPISVVAPVSALTLALKAKNKAPVSPFDRFATLSAKADLNPLYIKIYVPSSSKPTKPMEILLKRFGDGGSPVTVAQAIGFALYRYGEEKLEPPISAKKMNVNCWNFRMIEDDEVDYDFPALARTRPMTEFTSSNNRPARGRSREKPWDEFGLVEASESEFQENERQTPEYSKQAAEALAMTEETSSLAPASQASLNAPSAQPALSTTPTPVSFRNPITGPSFAPAPSLRHEPPKPPMDAPAAPTSTAAMRSGAPKALTIHYTDENFLTRSTKIEVTSDTYIAEVFDAVCKRLGVEKALHVLKVSGSTVVAPPDRTLEALGDRTDLDLVRRRFVGDGVFGLAGSPGSSSPNAPLFIGPGGTPKKGGKKAGPLAAATTLPGASRFESLAALSGNATYKRYNVLRKQPMSFAREASRILALDGEYIHIMPSSSEHHPTNQKLFEGTGKVTTIHFSSVVGCKVSRRHPKTFRLVVYKERESKRYDFEAVSASEAAEIVAEIKKGVNKFQENQALIAG
ncbi:uncharacterized protein PV09_06621 [Verruconis gallopava]|uniref:Stress-activated map kinase-interacting protein n=1 Tax=Verruconis gallopava TaxID=253628 RepID=A0A0D2A5X5_9PEZI|nr:uncharacterized protein PV09_06621 [Verruconis gallopava]KIW02133.1 hypothetical protein PV09_06621 [Verruconis gallopava]